MECLLLADILSTINFPFFILSAIYYGYFWHGEDVKGMKPLASEKMYRMFMDIVRNSTSRGTFQVCSFYLGVMKCTFTLSWRILNY